MVVIFAIVCHGELEAGINAPPVHQHGAGAALPMVATFLRTGDVQTLAAKSSPVTLGSSFRSCRRPFIVREQFTVDASELVCVQS